MGELSPSSAQRRSGSSLWRTVWMWRWPCRRQEMTEIHLGDRDLASQYIRFPQLYKWWCDLANNKGDTWWYDGLFI
jgi:hypothetical protein